MEEKALSIKDVLTMVLPVVTLLIGSFLTSFTQNRMFKRQRLWDLTKMEKELEQELIKNEAQFAREQMLKKLELYNRILRVERENEIFYRDLYGDVFFYPDKYQEVVQPLLYDSFHLLSEKVVIAVGEIENIIARQNAYEEGDEDDDKRYTEYYQTIISEIEKELAFFRKAYLETPAITEHSR